MIPNITHPSVVNFMVHVSDHITQTLSINEYFNLTEDRKKIITSAAFKMVKNSIPNNLNFTDEHIKIFLNSLLTKNEEIENYEFSAVIKNMVDNYDSFNKKPRGRRPKKTLKNDL